jgi:hypothetical protein
MFRTVLSTCALIASTGLAVAEPSRVQAQDIFEQTIVGRDLTALGVRLVVQPDGTISGKAFGRTVTGSWNWEQGYFCRDLNFGDDPLEPNCQLVTIDGNRVQFTADKGTGQSANLRLR